MQDCTALWSTRWEEGAPVETVVVIDGTEYTEISNPTIERAAMPSALSVGNCVSATLRVTVRTDDEIPTGAQVKLVSRLNDGTEHSEWIPQGTYYISRRSHDVVNGTYTLTCYDSMRKAAEPYMSSTDLDWPMRDTDVIADIAGRIGVSVDPRTVDAMAYHVTVDAPDGSEQMIQVLEQIAGAHGGNFVIAPAGALRLVPLVSATDASNAEKAVTVEAITSSITLGDAVAVTGVEMTDKSGTTFSTGDSTGQIVIVASNVYATQELCDALYSKLVGVVYSPYEIVGAHYDIRAEVGDYLISKDDVASVLWSEHLTLSVGPNSTISAPLIEAADEYPVRSAEAVLLDEIKKTADAAAEMAEEAITASVGKNQVYYTNTAPSGNDFEVNDIWFDTANDNKIYSWGGTAWIARELGDSAIKAINAEKLTAGDIAAERLTGSLLAAAQAVVHDLSALQATIGGVTIADDGIATSNGYFSLGGDGTFKMGTHDSYLSLAKGNEDWVFTVNFDNFYLSSASEEIRLGKENDVHTVIGSGYFEIEDITGAQIAHFGYGATAAGADDEQTVNAPWVTLGIRKEGYAIGAYSIAGGYGVSAMSGYSVSLGNLNETHGYASNINGGMMNINRSYMTVIGGGSKNTSLVGDNDVIAGGQHNRTESGMCNTISGGSANSIKDSTCCVIGGGDNNQILSSEDESIDSAWNKTISGGTFNKAVGSYSSIVGGSHNITNNVYSTVLGGKYNTANGNTALVAGEGNIASSHHQFVFGKFNIEDTENTYVEIVGGGEGDMSKPDDGITRLNLRTLDWSGNETLSGKLTATDIVLTGDNAHESVGTMLTAMQTDLSSLISDLGVVQTDLVNVQTNVNKLAALDAVTYKSLTFVGGDYGSCAVRHYFRWGRICQIYMVLSSNKAIPTQTELFSGAPIPVTADNRCFFRNADGLVYTASIEHDGTVKTRGAWPTGKTFYGYMTYIISTSDTL